MAKKVYVDSALWKSIDSAVRKSTSCVDFSLLKVMNNDGSVYKDLIGDSYSTFDDIVRVCEYFTDITLKPD